MLQPFLVITSSEIDSCFSIHDSSSHNDVTTSDDKARWAGMWRSIILSSLGLTAFPYCLWLKSLWLSDLQELLTNIAGDKSLRLKFFQGPMKDFEIIQWTIKGTRKVVMDQQRIIEKVGDTITLFAKEAADEENKALQLTKLEGAYIPPHLLSKWTSRLSTLTTLSIRDGSVLTEKVAHCIVSPQLDPSLHFQRCDFLELFEFCPGHFVGWAICGRDAELTVIFSQRDTCPSFRDLTCLYITGSTVDENMSAFFKGLRDNSLANFSVLSSNDIGYGTLDGLMQHASSLRTLSLLSLQPTIIPFLHLLSKCQDLESLELEFRYSPLSIGPANGKDPLLEVALWLKENKHLMRLRIIYLQGTSQLLSEVLRSPVMRLKELEVILLGNEEPFYPALAQQTSLEVLYVRSQAESPDSEIRHDILVDSICSCKALRNLDVMYDGIEFTAKDLQQLSKSLPDLELLKFEGDNMKDDVFPPLARMPKLKTININGFSHFTYEGIKSFLEDIKASSHRRQGFRLHVMAQWTGAMIRSAQVAVLTKLASEIPGGKFEFEYWRELDEESLSDLSD